MFSVTDGRTKTGNKYLEDQGFTHHKWVTQVVQVGALVGVLFLTYLRLRALSRAN